MLIYILRSNWFFYCAITIYIPFMFFKSNSIWFEKYKSVILFVSQITKQTFYLILHKRVFTLTLKQKLKGK